MGVVSVYEDWKGSRSSKDSSGRKYTRTFIVTLDVVGSNPTREVRLAAGVPDRGDVHPDDGAAKCRSVTPRETDSRTIWRVNADYTTSTTDWDAGGGVEEDPVNETPLERWGFWSRTEVAWHDNALGSIVNSAKQPFDPAPQIERHYLTVTITRNELSYSPTAAKGFIGTVNSNVTVNIGREPYVATLRTALMTDYSGEYHVRDSYTYWTVTYTIMINPFVWILPIALGWDFLLVNQGTQYLNANGKLQKRDDGSSDIMRLTNSGGKLADNAAATATTWEAFRVYDETDWSGLGLDLS